MTTESQVDVFTPAERINLLVQFTGQAMQGILANGETPFDSVSRLAVKHAKLTVHALETQFREEYATKAAELKAAQEAAANTPRILVPGGSFTQ